MRQLVIRGWRFLRACWLAAGVTVLILLLAESCYRAQSAARKVVRSARATQAIPSQATEWGAELARENQASIPLSWKPYVYWQRRPFTGRYITIDSLGRRVTPQPRVRGRPVARVFFFGGSTMWGSSLRGDHTIAAEAARRLHEAADSNVGVEVTNFGEMGYVFTQELIELILQLRAGNTPDVVVFYDGINEVAAAVQNGAPGVPQNEAKRAADFSMGRILDRSRFTSGIGEDLRALGMLSRAAMEQLEVIERLEMLVRPAAPPLPSPDAAARALARTYAENVRIVESLSRAYGFEAIYVWQPSLHATAKQLTPFEAQLMAGIRSDAAERRMQEIHAAIPPILDSAVAAIAPDRFINGVSLFTGDTMQVFTDQIGHNTEEAIPIIVRAFWPQLQAAVARRKPNSPVTP